MSKPTSRNRRLMDLLPGDHRWGELLGVLATTFELDPHFFETDYLPALLRLGSWDDTGWVSRIALEKGLSSLEGIWVAMDHRRYRGRPRSLQVEVRPAVGVQGTTLHAKVSVLIYERAVRVQVASANLTEPGYRQNREVAISLVASPEAPEEVALTKQVLAGMRNRLTPWWSPTAERVLALAHERVDAWPSQTSDATFLWSDGDNVLWKRVVEAWPEGAPLESITIVSPFWSEEADRGPLRQLVEALRIRASVPTLLPIRLLTEAEPDNTNWRPRLPPLGVFDPRALGLTLTAQAVLPWPTDDGNDAARQQRALHAKVVLLQGAKRSIAYCGSANFTARGWGFGSARANIEAGLLFSGSTTELVRSILPPVTGPVVQVTPENLPAAAVVNDAESFPTFLLGVWLEPDSRATDQLVLRIEADADRVCGPWSLHRISGAQTLCSGRPTDPPSQVLPIDRAVLEDLLKDQEVEVSWWDSPTPARYPVNIALAARAALPVAPGSTDPGESALLAYYQGRLSFEELYPPPPGWEEVDDQSPRAAKELESNVDTSRIQSYQVREFVEALSGLRQDLLAVAQATEASMRRGVLGAVSPVALAKEIEHRVSDGRRSATAAGFELVELASCLLEARGAENAKPAWPHVIDEGLALIGKTLARVTKAHPVLGHEDSEFQNFAKSILGDSFLGSPS